MPCKKTPPEKTATPTHLQALFQLIDTPGHLFLERGARRVDTEMISEALGYPVQLHLHSG
jgi:hypothetical protein